ncbi:hypothetical protein ACIP93_33580 [Streptomyces sp. NPDC088745]|uniref:hypothetical protein n=1 Tax=Streptomyces sp. NPDC088745 TaxID=3365884 RepID=UPI00382E31F4
MLPVQDALFASLSLDPPKAPRVPLPLGELPISSIPAAYDREHLYSPKAGTAERVEHRPGDVFGPLPMSLAGKAWRAWWDTEANTTTPDFLGLQEGDEITVVGVGPATVVSTCRFGAVVRFALPPCDWHEKTHAEMYVTARNQVGHWYR